MTNHPPLHELAAYWLDRAPSIETASDAVSALDDAMTLVLAGLPHEVWVGKPPVALGDDGVARPVHYLPVKVSGSISRAAFMIAQFVTALRAFGEHNGKLLIEGGSMRVDVTGNILPMADTVTIRANVAGLPADVSANAA